MIAIHSIQLFKLTNLEKFKHLYIINKYGNYFFSPDNFALHQIHFTDNCYKCIIYNNFTNYQ